MLMGCEMVESRPSSHIQGLQEWGEAKLMECLPSTSIGAHPMFCQISARHQVNALSRVSIQHRVADPTLTPVVNTQKRKEEE